MLACLLKLSKMNLNIDDLPKISYKPFQREGSFLFLEAVRLGDNMKVEEVLNKNRLLIYDFNQFHQTALHIAGKKCNFLLLKSLIEHGAELNAIDLAGKTALFIALERNFLNGIRYLLYSGANPWSSSKECVYEKIVKSKEAKNYLKKAREISIIAKFVKHEADKKKFWLTQRRYFAKILKEN
jgi:ankyrin repeat protein